MPTTFRRPRAQLQWTVGGYPSAVVYQTDFETWPAAIFPLNAPLGYYTDVGVGGSRGALWNRSSAGAGSDNVGAFTSLVIGRSYTLDLSVRRWDGAASPGFGFSIGGATSAVATVTNSHVTRSVTFTASSTTHALALTCNAAARYAIDDVKLTQNSSGSGTTTVKPEDGRVSLDEGAVPYCVAVLDMRVTDLAAIETLDPRAGRRVQLTGSDLVTGQSRLFDLELSTRTVTHKPKGRVTLRLTSDEALLMRYAQLTNDEAPIALAGNLRNVVNYVLNKVIPGAALEASPSPNFNATPTWEVTSLHTNPDVVNTYGFSLGQNATALQRVNFGGQGALQWEVVAAGISNMVFVPGSNLDVFRVSPGKWYVAAIQQSSPTSRTTRCGVQFYAGAGTSPMGTVWGAYSAGGAPGGVWVSHHVVARAPAGAQSMVPFVSTEGNIATQAQWARMPMVYEGDRHVGHFMGASTSDTWYDYSWAESAHGSPSIRIPKFPNQPPLEALIWKAGASAWDFLEPLLAKYGLRLFCDEQRKWRLVDASAYTVAGSRIFNGANSPEGQDSISVDDPDLYCTGVLLRYSWTDRDGIRQTEEDFAGTPGNVLTKNLRDTPYPGPGTAAKMLATRTARGRVQDIEAPSDWTVTPGMAGTVTLPGTVSQSGRITAVEWSLSEGLMRPRVRQAA